MSKNDKERAILAANPNMHWSDVMIKAEKAKTIDLKSVIQMRLSKIYATHLS